MFEDARKRLYWVFAISGFAGLLYESIWTHYLKLFLGHAAYAQALVLAIFMGGLAVGSLLAARWSPRWPNLLRAYAIAEAAIGVLALVFHETFGLATRLAYGWLLPLLVGSPEAVHTAKWLLSAALILPQTILLGMTFPLMTAGVLRAFPERPGRSVAVLYFTNSLGAAAGVLASGFLLVGLVGLPGTVRLAGLLNLGVALLVWRWFGEKRATACEESALCTPARARDAGYVLFLGASLVTGASSFLYEIGWIRMLSLVLGSSTHAFELMLSAFILGLALGGLWVQRRIDSMPGPVGYLAVVQVAMGLFALASLPLYGKAFGLMGWLVNTLPPTGGGYVLFNLASNGIALATMLPATFCAGMTLPLITYHLLRKGHGEKSIGGVYAANTVGAIAAVFFATHVGMPVLGLKGLLVLGAGLDIALGAVLAWRAEGRTGARAAAAGAAGLLALAGAVGAFELDPAKMASGVYRRGKMLLPEEAVTYHRDGKTATVSLIYNRNFGELRIATNGKVDAAVTLSNDSAPSMDEFTMILAGIVPMSLHPQARTAACIGFGSGLTTHTLLCNPNLKEVDTIEIEAEMVRAAAAFRPRNELAYTDPRSHVYIEDAKTYFSTSGKKYDLIVSEPSNPWVSGVSSLFSLEFYRHVRQYLAPHGLFVQWLQLYEIDTLRVMSVLKALEANFSEYAVYAANDTDAIIVAKNGGPLGGPDRDLLKTPGLAAVLRRASIAGVQDLQNRKVGDNRAWKGLTSTFAIDANSDYYPVLDQGAARDRFLRRQAADLLVFTREPLPTLSMLSGLSRQPGTDVLRALFFEGTTRAHRSTLVRDLLRSNDVRGMRFYLPDPVLQELAPIAGWLRSPDAGPFPLQSFVAAAQKVLPDLPPEELRELWRPLRSSAAAARLSPVDRLWVEFFLATGEHDPERMSATARALLASGTAADPATRRYVVSAALLGAVAGGRGSEALQIWQEHGASLNLGDDLLLRLLLAKARAAARLPVS
ncbi:MAG: spermidine synthase [Deltaproteobacteria bacterium]|nr:spermidine synthase [Deltaproteobacteria bacterium]